jgi:hypothetical protein
VSGLTDGDRPGGNNQQNGQKRPTDPSKSRQTRIVKFLHDSPDLKLRRMMRPRFVRRHEQCDRDEYSSNYLHGLVRTNARCLGPRTRNVRVHTHVEIGRLWMEVGIARIERNDVALARSPDARSVTPRGPPHRIDVGRSPVLGAAVSAQSVRSSGSINALRRVVGGP